MKNLKFSIKILLVILSAALVSTAAVSVVSYSELSRLSDYSQQVNAELGQYASGNTEHAMETVTRAYVDTFANLVMESFDETFVDIVNEIYSLEYYLKLIYYHSDLFPGYEVPPPEETEADVLAARMSLSPGVSVTPELQREMLLVSNIEALFMSSLIYNTSLNSLYLGTESGIILRYSADRDISPDYDARLRPWYTEAVTEANNGGVWQDTYLDPFGHVTTTFSVPFYRADGEIAGVLASDIYLDTLLTNVTRTQIGENGYSFLLDDNGNYIAHPSKDYGQKHVEDTSGDMFINYYPLTVNGWQLGIAVDNNEVTSNALQMKDMIDTRAAEAKTQMSEMINGVLIRFLIITGAVIAVVSVLSVLVSRSVTRPIKRLAAGVAAVGKGKLNEKIHADTKDEIGLLAENFNKMMDDLKAYIENLASVTAEKERINSDLRVATDIQADMLPKIFPLFSNRSDLHIAALMQPAKEVGGDFYDFFFLDELQTKIALVIADVSGKGVPAALFMVIAKILIKNNKDLPLEDILSHANNLLAEDNNSSMFVTTYFSVLDIPTGKYTYINAGHNPPILYRRETKELSLLTAPKAPPLAIFPNKKYTRQELTLQTGDALLLYTDGVTEAFNRQAEMYGTERLLETLAELAEKPVEEAVGELHKSVKDFAGEEPQSDDITMLFCRYLM
jgi:sigma-B regulation protein RsbU (phosphoserine phosphatase)